jgi:hypothetical protein
MFKDMRTLFVHWVINVSYYVMFVHRRLFISC